MEVLVPESDEEVGSEGDEKCRPAKAAKHFLKPVSDSLPPPAEQPTRTGLLSRKNAAESAEQKKKPQDSSLKSLIATANEAKQAQAPQPPLARQKPSAEKPARPASGPLRTVELNTAEDLPIICSYKPLPNVFGQGRLAPGAACTFGRIAKVRPAACVPARGNPAAPAGDAPGRASPGRGAAQAHRPPQAPPGSHRPPADAPGRSGDDSDGDEPRAARLRSSAGARGGLNRPSSSFVAAAATAGDFDPSNPFLDSAPENAPGSPGGADNGALGVMDITAMSQRRIWSFGGGGGGGAGASGAAAEGGAGGSGEGEQRGVRDRPLKAGKAGTNFVRLNLGKKGGKGGRHFLSKAGAQRKFKGKPGRGGFGGRGGRFGFRRKAAAGLTGDTARRQPGLVRDEAEWDEAERIAAEGAAAAAFAEEGAGGGGAGGADADAEMEDAAAGGAEAAAAAAERRAASRGASAGHSAAQQRAAPRRPAAAESDGGGSDSDGDGRCPAELPGGYAANTAAVPARKRKRGEAAAAPLTAWEARAAARKKEAVSAAAAAAAGKGGSGRVPPEVEAAVRDAAADPTEANLKALLRLAFGHSGFRDGQLEIIGRVLRRENTLAVLPTGQGKSLCYQLPALLLPGLTIVVSPLVALMEDQLAHLPPALPGAALHSAQPPAAAAAAIAALRAGRLRLLFLSPERFLSPRFRALLQSVPPGGHPRLVVVDEAHCASEWSHNFRPAYQRLGAAISALSPLCGGERPSVLAVTATATRRTEAHCADLLGVPRPGGVVRLGSVRTNLRLSVVRSEQDRRLEHLLALLRPSAAAARHSRLRAAGVQPAAGTSSGGPLGIGVPACQLGSFANDLAKLETGSAIVYCGYRFEAERVAGHLFQNGVSAAAYHSGLKPEERAKVLRLFMAGRLRVVCATVAFGMGLDKADVRCVVNYSLPRSIEAFVQQVGRAGRDGGEALGVTFLDTTDYLRLRALTFTDSADTETMERLVERVFPDEVFERGPEEKGEGGGGGGYGYFCLHVEKVSKALDVREEVLETALTYLGLAPDPPPPRPADPSTSADPSSSADPPSASAAPADPHLRILPDVRCQLSVGFYRTDPEELSQRDDLVAAVLACGRKGRDSGRWTCPVGEIVQRLRCSFSDLDARLVALAAEGEVSFDLRERGLAYQVVRLPADRGAVAKELARRFDQAEGCQARRVAAEQVSKLDAMINAAEAAAALLAAAGSAGGSAEVSADGSARDQEAVLRERIDAYFRADWGGRSADSAPAAGAEAGAAAAAEEGAAAAAATAQELFRRPEAVKTDSQFLLADIRALLRQAASGGAADARLSATTLARILCGVSSPGVNTELWSKMPFWGRYGAFDFREVARRVRAEAERGGGGGGGGGGGAGRDE